MTNTFQAPVEFDEPAPDPESYFSADTLGNLEFEDLATTRPAPPDLNPALLNVWALRTEYQQACEKVAAIENDIRFGNGPSVRAAMPQIRQLRARAEADRPYLIAIQDVVAEWRDAEELYDTALAHLQWARDQLEAATAAANAHPDDIASARAQVKLCETFVPATPPAERFMPALTAAIQARADAAGGPDKIVSGDDVDNLLMDLRTADEQTLRDARTQRQRIGREHDRAELAAAAAFAAAESRSAEHITAQLDALATEIRVLDVAARYQMARPINLGDNALGGLPESVRTPLRALAELPFTITPVYAAPSRQRTAALHTLRAAAAAADRKVLWCSTTPDGANRAQADDLADSAATLSEAHQQIRDGNWCLPPGSLLIIDDAASANPDAIADLAEHVAHNNSGLILLDTMPAPWPPPPSRRLVRLLQADLPWTVSLGPPPDIAATGHPNPPDLDPVIAQAGRLAPHLLDDGLREALTRRDELHVANRSAYQRHLNATWMRSRSRDTSLDNSPDPGISL